MKFGDQRAYVWPSEQELYIEVFLNKPWAISHQRGLNLDLGKVCEANDTATNLLKRSISSARRP
jgi:hypothetical protein